MLKHDNPFVLVTAKPPGQNHFDPVTIREPLALALPAKHRKCHEHNSKILTAIRGKSLNAPARVESGWLTALSHRATLDFEPFFTAETQSYEAINFEL
jgi:hypothetical protein